MGTVAVQRVFSKVIGLITLSLIVSVSSGCATRALMSSDRYEKPKTETQQLHSSDTSPALTDEEQYALAQAYQVAIKQ